MHNLKKKGIFVLRTCYLKGVISGVNVFHGLLFLFLCTTIIFSGKLDNITTKEFLNLVISAVYCA